MNADMTSPCVPKKGDETQEVCISLGGNVFVNIKGELRFEMIPDILQGAFFMDLGNLWNEKSSVDILALRPSTGFGLRFVTPIGPVALDLGINLDPDQSRREEKWNLHFNIGVF